MIVLSGKVLTVANGQARLQFSDEKPSIMVKLQSKAKDTPPTAGEIITILNGELRSEKDNDNRNYFYIDCYNYSAGAPEKGINLVAYHGNLGQDPEMKYFESGSQVTNTSIAVKRNKNETDWMRVNFWGKAGEVVGEYVRKGSQVGFEGQLDMREYEKEGETRIAYEIKANKVHLLGKSGNNQQNQQPEDEF
jgi:single-strand DNA-binding protein